MSGSSGMQVKSMTRTEEDFPALSTHDRFLAHARFMNCQRGMWTWESYASRYEKKLQKLDDTECAGGEDRRGVIEALALVSVVAICELHFLVFIVR